MLVAISARFISRLLRLDRLQLHAPAHPRIVAHVDEARHGRGEDARLLLMGQVPALVQLKHLHLHRQRQPTPDSGCTSGCTSPRPRSPAPVPVPQRRRLLQAPRESPRVLDGHDAVLPAVDEQNAPQLG